MQIIRTHRAAVSTGGRSVAARWQAMAGVHEQGKTSAATAASQLSIPVTVNFTGNYRK